ncbi:tripartite tricarboxylate transporter substrate binding protein [Pseudorhodoplanes sp.]|uniref:Bug family tripartite tricarboxylate transporter substrate binding protein n=1 Tax=Pseudorhodoplanes sp. TaxID=1934341 RepID=UPI002B8F091A|nr:tripartite tricarboxylate transporter substrate binding protein [Pseudorhodoplanes sp.]HWV40495.1 tripartite tricarboxylate transporter substrate binding protein [Pseudorhodoplanes sp.]
MIVRRSLLVAGMFALALSGSIPARAQDYPAHPVKIIVPIGPSGSYDILGRLVADQLSKRLNQSFVVENRPGGGTIVGTKAAVAAPPDGYTLLVGGLSNVVFNAGLYKSLPYDPLNDLVPVALILNISYTLVGSNNLPYKTAQEIVAAAKAKPGTIKLANAGIGTGQHVLGAAFQAITGTKFLEVPYRGSSLAYPDVLSGRVDLFLDSTPAALPYVKSGQARGIAILAKNRNPGAPDLPTMTESGVPGLEIDSWIGIFAPAKTPPSVIALLRKHIAEAGPEMKPRLASVGGELMDVPADKINAVVKADYDKWIKIIKDAGIHLD